MHSKTDFKSIGSRIFSGVELPAAGLGAIAAATVFLCMLLSVLLFTLPSGDPAVSKEEYQALNMGMSYQEAVQVIGNEGNMTIDTTMEVLGKTYNKTTYDWTGNDGSVVVLSFEDGRLIQKSMAR